MGEFNFDKLDAEINKIKAEKQAKIDAQATAVEQPDPNALAAPEIQQDAPVQPQVAPTLAPPVDPNAQASPPVSPALAPPVPTEVAPEKPEEELLVQQDFDINKFLGRPDPLDTSQAASEPADTNKLPGKSKALLADEKARNLLSRLGDELPSGQEQPLVQQGFGPGQPIVSGRIAQGNIGTRAMNELISLGYSHEDVASALAFQQANLPPSKKFQMAAGAAASVAIPAAINLLPGMAAAPEEMITVPLTAKLLTKLGLRAAGAGGAGAAGAIADVAADPDRDLTIENMKHAAKAGFIEEGALEAVFGGAELGFGRAFGRGGRMAAENIDEINSMLARSAKRRGTKQSIHLLPGQASLLPSAQAAEAMAESAIFGANPIAKTKALLRKNATALVNDLPAEIAGKAKILSADHVRNVTRSVIKGEESFHKNAVSAAFDMVDDSVAKGTKGTVPISKEVAVPAGRVLDEFGQPVIKAGTEEVVEQVSKASQFIKLDAVKKEANAIRTASEASNKVAYTGEVKRIVDALADGLDATNFKGAQEMRSEMISILRDLEAAGTPNSSLKKAAGKLTPLIDDAMAEAAESIGGDTLKMWRRSNRLHKANKLLFDDKVITTIMNDAALTNPEVVFDVFKSSDSRQIKRFVKAFGDNPEQFKQVKASFLAGMIDDTAIKNIDAFKASGKGEPLGEVMLKQFNELKSVEKHLFSKSESKLIRERLRTISLAQKSGESGLVGLRAAQGLGLVGIAAATLSGGKGPEIGAASSLLVIGPSVLASLLMRRPNFSKALAQGFKVSPTSKEGIKITGRLGRMVLEERKRISKRRENVEAKLNKARPTEPQITLSDQQGFQGHKLR